MNIKADITHIPISTISPLKQAAKRGLDLLGAGLSLLAIWPLLLLIAVLIKLSSEGPVFFKQRRTGLKGREFYIYKFRSMKVHEVSGVIAQAQREDIRVTAIGKFIRRTSIDELPQLINVIRGEMSLVGPRPHAVSHDKYYGSVIDNYSLRYEMKPGITGLAQVTGNRGETKTIEDMKRRINKDIEYIENYTLFLDVKIILKTPLAAFGDNVY